MSVRSRAVVTWLVAAAIATGLALSTPCPSARARDRGFEAGLRLGYGVPLGEISDPGGDVGDVISGQLPFWLDVGYRANANVFVGLYAHYGVGFLGDDIDEVCDLSDDVDCSASDVRFGGQVHYHIAPHDTADPWVGLGVGYEWASFSVDGGGAEGSVTASGFEFANMQLGVDLKAARHFYVGPFVSFSIGQYDDVSTDCSGFGCGGFVGGDIEDKALHHWIVFGARGAYAP